MAKITGWHLKEDDKIFISFIHGGETFNAELPPEMYGEIITGGPPSADKVIRSLIDEITAIKKKRLLYIDNIAADEDKLKKRTNVIMKEIGEARKDMKDANDKFELSKAKNVIDSCKAEFIGLEKIKSLLNERRHLVRLTYQEEGKLRADILKKVG